MYRSIGCPFTVKLCDRVSFSGTKLCDRVLHLISKLCDRVSCGRMPFRVRVLLKQWILAKFFETGYTFGAFFMRQGTWGIFYATGYRVWRDLPHTPAFPWSNALPAWICPCYRITHYAIELSLRGEIHLLEKAYEIFSEQKGFIWIFLENKGFLPKVYEIFLE